jgi:hypothetical protein
MRLFFIAMLLSISQAAIPIPGKAPNRPAGSSQNVQNNPANNQGPATTPTVANPATTEKDQNTSNEPTKANAQETIVIREPITVSVGSMPHKDWWDRAYVIFTGMLVIIGGGGVLAALRTLRAIKRQGDLMERQTVTAEKAAESAKQSAESDERAVRLTERADVLLEAAGLNSPSGQIDGQAMVKLVFKNFGRTRANNVVLNVDLLVPGVSPVPTDMPQIAMASGDSQTVTFGNFMSCMTRETFIAISRGKERLEFIGKVTYEDVFGDSHICECGGYFEYRTRSFVCTKNEGK